MTILNEEQEQLLNTVKVAYEDILPVLRRMEDEYEHAVYRAKKSIRDAVAAAQDGRVPMARIVEDATDMRYAQKLKSWLLPPEAVVGRAMDESAAQVETPSIYAEAIESIETVSRNPKTGVFSVVYNDNEYTVTAMGPDAEPWAEREADVPQEVYDLIQGRFPGFVVLEEDEW